MESSIASHRVKVSIGSIGEVVRVLVPVDRPPVAGRLADRVHGEQRHVRTDDLLGDVDEWVAQHQIAEAAVFVVWRRYVLGPVVLGQRLDERIHLGPDLLEAGVVEERTGSRVALLAVERELLGR